jgi:hypothetical protein
MRDEDRNQSKQPRNSSPPAPAGGEYALQDEWAPTHRPELTRRFGVMLDGLVLARDPNGITGTADLIKVVSSRPPAVELEGLLSVASRSGSWLDSDQHVRLARLVIVVQAENRWIIPALKQYLLAHPQPDGGLLRIVLVRCQIEMPLIWRGYEELDAAQLLLLDRTMPPGGAEQVPFEPA